MNQPLKWHGGKHYLAKWIIEQMPPHTHYVEPFFGGGSVLLSKDPEGVSEVANDRNCELINFWRVLRSEIEFEKFCRAVQATPFSKVEFDEASYLSMDPVTRAVRFFIRNRQSRQGLMRDFATLSRNRTRRGMNEQVSSWLTAVDGLPEVHDRLKRVVIHNVPAVAVILSQDGPNTLFYCDPPYVHETRTARDAYEAEMSDDDHEELLYTLSQIEGSSC